MGHGVVQTSRRSMPPVWTDALDSRVEIDDQTRNWRPDSPITSAGLRALAARPWRPQDTTASTRSEAIGLVGGRDNRPSEADLAQATSRLCVVITAPLHTDAPNSAPVRVSLGNSPSSQGFNRAALGNSGYVGGVGRYRESYPRYFALLPNDLAETIDVVITNNVRWGLEPEPGEEDIRDLCLAAAHRITTEDQLARTLVRARHDT